MINRLREYPSIQLPSIRDAGWPDEINQPLINFLFGIYSTPGLEEPRQILHWTMRKIIGDKQPASTGERDLNGLEGLILYAVLDTYSTIFGFGAPARLSNETIQKVYPKERFGSLVEQARVWSESDPVSQHGVTLGAYDPPHIGHTLDITKIYPFTSRIMVGVEPDWSVSKRKGKPGDERPRFPYKMWKMWQFAMLPVVDAVFEIPIEPKDDPRTFYPDLYHKLNVKVQGTEHNHELIKIYKRNMQQVGGQVITTNKKVSFLHRFVNFRSTENMRRLARLYGGMDVAMDVWREKIAKREHDIQAKYDMRVK